MADDARDEISSILRVRPVRLDASAVSACSRARYFWTNLPVDPLAQKEVELESALDPGWRKVVQVTQRRAASLYPLLVSLF